MTESTEASPSVEEGGINLILRQGGEEIILRQIALGFQPLILIEPDVDEEKITVDATGLTPEDIAGTFELLAELIRSQFNLTPEGPTTTEESN